jgi:hypothetical protein
VTAFQLSLRAGIVFLAIVRAAFAEAPPALPDSNPLPPPADFQPGGIADQYGSDEHDAATSLVAHPCQGAAPNCACNWGDYSMKGSMCRVFGGAEYLLLRAHFSEAIGFVQVTDSLRNGLPYEHSQAQELNFRYNSAFRTFVGYHLSQTSDVQLTYLHINTGVALNGSPSSPNQFAIDAFGDRATFGQTIATNATVNINAFDLDYVRRYVVNEGRVAFRAAGGLRFADVRQGYGSSTFDATGNLQGNGVFNTHFFGVGPHFGLQGQARRRANSPFSLVARGAGSLLVGGYDVSSGAVFTGMGGADQFARRTLTVPVLEAEIGAAWQPTPSFTLSAGWMVQAWFDLGVSGGTNGGKYIEVDDSNIMAFDGLFTRGMWQY